MPSKNYWILLACSLMVFAGIYFFFGRSDLVAPEDQILVDEKTRTDDYLLELDKNFNSEYKNLYGEHFQEFEFSISKVNEFIDFVNEGEFDKAYGMLHVKYRTDFNTFTSVYEYYFPKSVIVNDFKVDKDRYYMKVTLIDEIGNEKTEGNKYATQESSERVFTIFKDGIIADTEVLKK